MTQQTPGITTDRPADTTSEPMPPPDQSTADITAPPAPSAAFPDNGWRDAHEASATSPASDESTTDQASAASNGLLRDSSAFTARWTSIQTTFVDSPREAVAQADALVADVIQELARVFAGERQRLEAAWSGGESVSTEDLRQALQKYRDFFQALLRS